MKNNILKLIGCLFVAGFMTSCGKETPTKESLPYEYASASRKPVKYHVQFWQGGHVIKEYFCTNHHGDMTNKCHYFILSDGTVISRGPNWTYTITPIWDNNEVKQ